MSSSPSPCDIDALLLKAGAYRWAMIPVAEVDPEAVAAYRRWIADGRHGAMSYLDRHHDVRDNPALLLPGARSMIITAFSYYIPFTRPARALPIARYALVDDYHETLKKALRPVVNALRDSMGAKSRVLVDSAPLRERYWARRARLGEICRNGQLIIPGAGSYFFLATILTTAELPPSAPPVDTDSDTLGRCADRCNACAASCPGHAISPEGDFDARRCLSYLTIEAPADTPPTSAFYGCDVCQEVCPHNQPLLRGEITIPTIFKLREEIASLTPEQVKELTPESYVTLMAHSAMRRAPLEKLLRNLANFS